MTFTKIVVAGSTGALADHFLRAALSYTEPKFDITVLTRKDSNKTPSLPGATLVPIDYDDHDALVQVVRGHDAIVSLVGGLAAIDTDLKLHAAAQAAGVRRIFTSEYTVDILHPEMVSLYSHPDWPQDRNTVLTKARKFLAFAEEGSSTSYTTLMPSAFMDNWLEGVYGLWDPKGRKMTLLDGGDIAFTGCSLPFLAACIIAALRMDEEKTRNKRITVSEVRTTMREILNTYEKATGDRFEVANDTNANLLETRDAALKRGDFVFATLYTHMTGAFNGRGAGDLSEGLKFDGDGFVTLKRKTLEELCAEAVEKVGKA